MQNLENLDVFEILITQKLLKCPKDPFVRSALNLYRNVVSILYLIKINTNLSHLAFIKWLLSSCSNLATNVFIREFGYIPFCVCITLRSGNSDVIDRKQKWLKGTQISQCEDVTNKNYEIEKNSLKLFNLSVVKMLHLIQSLLCTLALLRLLFHKKCRCHSTCIINTLMTFMFFVF